MISSNAAIVPIRSLRSPQCSVSMLHRRKGVRKGATRSSPGTGGVRREAGVEGIATHDRCRDSPLHQLAGPPPRAGRILRPQLLQHRGGQHLRQDLRRLSRPARNRGIAAPRPVMPLDKASQTGSPSSSRRPAPPPCCARTHRAPTPLDRGGLVDLAAQAPVGGEIGEDRAVRLPAILQLRLGKGVSAVVLATAAAGLTVTTIATASTSAARRASPPVPLPPCWRRPVHQKPSEASNAAAGPASCRSPPASCPKIQASASAVRNIGTDRI